MRSDQSSKEPIYKMSYYSIYTRVSTKKQDLYEVAKAYGWEKAYKSTTVKAIDDYLGKVVERMVHFIEVDGFGYSPERARREGIRYILLPRVEQWETVRKNMSARGQLEAFRAILKMEFQWSNKKLDDMCAWKREHGIWSQLPNIEEEVKMYEQVCLYAYAMSQAGQH